MKFWLQLEKNRIGNVEIAVMEMKNHNGNYHYYVFGEVLLNKILQSKKLLEEVIFKVPPYFFTLFSTL